MNGPVFLCFQRRDNVVVVLYEQAKRCAQVMVFENGLVVVEQCNVRAIGTSTTRIGQHTARLTCCRYVQWRHQGV